MLFIFAGKTRPSRHLPGTLVLLSLFWHGKYVLEELKFCTFFLSVFITSTVYDLNFGTEIMKDSQGFY